MVKPIRGSESFNIGLAKAADIYSAGIRGASQVANAAANAKLIYDLGVFVANHAAGGGLTPENIQRLLPERQEVVTKKPRKKRGVSRYNALIKKFIEEKKTKKKMNQEQRRKMFAAAAKKASAALRKEKKKKGR